MKQNRSFAILISFVILAVGARLAYAKYRVGANWVAAWIGAGAFVAALVVFPQSRLLINGIRRSYCVWDISIRSRDRDCS
jgi:hypothetical protein